MGFNEASPDEGWGDVLFSPHRIPLWKRGVRTPELGPMTGGGFSYIFLCSKP